MSLEICKLPNLLVLVLGNKANNYHLEKLPSIKILCNRFHISENDDIYLELFVLLRSDIYLRESKGGVVCKCDIFGVISTGLLRRQKQERSDKKSERNIRRYATLPTVCLIQSDVLWERH